ncbi:MAG: PAS domain S-box protein [Gemmatimonadota bacterium]
MTTLKRTRAPAGDREIARLIARLRATEARLRELTAGQVDAVIDAAGESHLLVEGQQALVRVVDAERSAAAATAAILDAIPVQIALLDAQGGILVVNEAWRRYGAAGQGVVERTGPGVNYLVTCDTATGEEAEDALAVARGLRAVLDGGLESFVREYPCHSPTEKRWFRMIATRAQLGPTNGAAVIHVDVTERHLAEAALRRLNRLHRMVSETSDAVVRVEDAGALFDRVCQAAFTTGGIPLAAVLLLDADRSAVRTAAVRTAAVRGDDAERAGALDASLTDLSTSAGPIATALSTGVIEVCADLEDHPGMAPWQRHALAAGFHAVAAFPFRLKGAVDGVFVVWVRERDYFGPEEISLFETVSHNLSVALEAMARTQAKDIAEERLRRSEERYRDLVENSHDIIWSLDLSGRALFVNSACRTAFGREPAELIGELLPQLLPPLAGTEQADLTTLEYESRIDRPDGTSAFLLSTSRIVRNSAGAVVAVTGISKDITERRASEQRIADQAALIDQANDAIMLKGMDDRILFWSRGAERTYGWSAEEALGANTQTLLGINTKLYSDAKRNLLDTGEWQGELTKLNRSGRAVIVDCRWSLTRNADGTPKAILAIDSDVTERHALQRQFLRAQRLESIGSLAGGISHDLNNVFTPILLALEPLRELLPDADSMELLDTISQSAQRGADLVRQVLGFARGVEGERISVDAGEQVREIGRIVRETFPKSIEFEFRLEPRPWSLLGDPTQVHQVLMNLCVNARDAMPAGGTLSISVSNVQLDEVYVRMHPEAQQGDWVCFEVRDTGTGIPAEIREQIFDPFFTTKALGKGTGLGLSTVLGIVKSHKGFLDVRTTVGKGTTFQVYFPVARNPLGSGAGAPVKPPLPRGNGELLLLVDDEPSIRSTASRMLIRFGYRVVLASNGAEAVSLFVQHREEVAVVVTDMAMPVMDGPATIRAIRTIDPLVRIIGLSGFSSRGGVAKAVGADVAEFVVKPYTASILLQAINRVITAK